MNLNYLINHLNEQDQVVCVQLQALLYNICTKGDKYRNVINQFERFQTISTWCLDKPAFVEKFESKEEITLLQLEDILDKVICLPSKVKKYKNDVIMGLIDYKTSKKKEIGTKFIECNDYFVKNGINFLQKYLNNPIVKNEDIDAIKKVLETELIKEENKIRELLFQNYLKRCYQHENIALIREYKDGSKQKIILWRVLELLHHNYKNLYTDILSEKKLPLHKDKNQSQKTIDFLQRLTAKLFLVALKKINKQENSLLIKQLEEKAIDEFCTDTDLENHLSVVCTSYLKNKNRVAYLLNLNPEQIKETKERLELEYKKREKENKANYAKKNKQRKNDGLLPLLYKPLPLPILELKVGPLYEFNRRQRDSDIDSGDFYHEIYAQIIEKIEHGIFGYFETGQTNPEKVRSAILNIKTEVTGVLNYKIKGEFTNNEKTDKNISRKFLESQIEELNGKLSVGIFNSSEREKAIEEVDNLTGKLLKLKSFEDPRMGMKSQNKDSEDGIDGDDNSNDNFNWADEEDEEQDVLTFSGIEKNEFEKEEFEFGRNKVTILLNYIDSILSDSTTLLHEKDRQSFDEPRLMEILYIVDMIKLEINKKVNIENNKHCKSFLERLKIFILDTTKGSSDEKLGQNDREKKKRIRRKLYEELFWNFEVHQKTVLYKSLSKQIVENQQYKESKTEKERYPKMNHAFDYLQKKHQEKMDEEKILEEIISRDLTVKDKDKLIKSIKEGGGEILKQLIEAENDKWAIKTSTTNTNTK